MKTNGSNEGQNSSIVVQMCFHINHYKVVGVQLWWQQTQASKRADTTSISSLKKSFMVAHSYKKYIFMLIAFKHFWKSHNCFADLSSKLMEIQWERGKG